MRVLQGLRAHRFGKRGFTLVELAIVLAVAALLFAGLWRLMAGGNSQLRNQAAADQQRQLIAAVKAFLAFDAGQGATSFMMSPPLSGTPNNTAQLPIPTALEMAACDATKTGAAAFCRFLPAGFNNNTSNSYGQTYLIGVRLDQMNGTTPIAWSFMIITQGGQVIPDSEGAAIAGLTGGDGGFIYNAPVCNPTTGAPWACGVYGSWAVNPVNPGPAGYGFGVGEANAGHVASLTSVNQATAGAAPPTGPWLSRQNDPSLPDFRVVDPADARVYHDMNTMQQSLVMASPNATLPGTSAATTKTLLLAGEPDNRRDIYTLGNNIFMGIGGPATSVPPNPVPTSGGLFLDGGFIDGGVGLAWGGSNASSTRSAGEIRRVRKATIGYVVDNPTEPFSQATASTSLTVNGPVDTSPGVTPEWTSDCFFNPPSGPSCQAVLQVNGNTIVQGKLGALNLFAQSFVYDTGSTSDMRLKMDIRKLENPLDKLSRIAAVSYYMKGTETRKKLGVLAQEVEKVYPELVFESNGNKAVDYMGLVGPLVGAVRELRDQNITLRRQLEEQGQRLKKLEGTRAP